MPQTSHGNEEPVDFLRSLAADEGGSPPEPPGERRPAGEAVDVRCRCGQKLRIKARLAGTTVKCPACRSPLDVPRPQAADTSPSVEPAAIAIDVAAATAKANSARSRRNSQTPYYWLLGGSAVLIVVAPLIYFLAGPKPSGKTNSADTSLAAKSSPEDANDRGKSNEIAPPKDAAEPEVTPDDPQREPPIAKQPIAPKSLPVAEPPAKPEKAPAKKPANTPATIAGKQPAKESPPKKVTGTGRTPQATPVKPAATVSADKFDWLIGRPATIALHTGVIYEDVEVVSVRLDSQPRSIHSLRLKRRPTKTKRKRQRPPSQLSGWQIHTLETPDGRLTLKYDKKLRAAIVEQAVTQQQLAAERARRRAAVAARLRSRGHKIWPELSKDDQVKAVAEYKKFLIKVGKSFSDRVMRFRETRYFLFYTDLPEAEVELISKRLDAMYHELCKAFGIPAGKNIWRGKCVIVAFVRERDFVKFETEIMKYMPGSTVQGLMHGEYNGRCITACFRGEHFDYFAQTLVHETSHGFVHRFFSTVQLPAWINEGMADWIANMVVPLSDKIANRRAGAVARIRTTRSLGGDFFTAGTLEPWQYGVASDLTEFMLRGGNGLKYRRFIEDIKKGYTWRESLKRNYGVDEKGLTTLYGQSLRIVNLAP